MTALIRQCNSLIAVFEEQVRDHPKEIALVVEDGRSWTYSELDNLAAELSLHIAATIDSLQIDMGANDTPLVSVMMQRDAGIVAAILGTLKAGAAYVPVDPAFPPDRQSYIFKHSRCHLAVLDEECLEKAKELGVDLPPTVVVVSRTAVVSKQQPPLVVTGAVQKQLQQSIASKRAEARERVNGGLAYVLYTSGSTGNPKGVMVKQEGVVNIINWFGNELAVGPGKKVLGLTTFCFDISVLEMFMPLLHGATLVLAFSSTQKDPFRLLDIVEEQRVDIVQATPTTFEMMLATGWRGDPLLDLLVGGEAFRPALLPMVANSRSVRNVYGPTETTIWSSSYTLPRDIFTTKHAASPPPPIPIGAPISETQFYLATEADVNRLAGADEEGELCIGGVGVARGYLHADDLTVGRFVSTPYDSYGGKIYRTGDVVKRIPGAGSYVFVRRMDDQVKIDGFRIELAEIEQVFLLDERVEQAVALVRNGRLAIYLQPSSGHTLDPAALDAVFSLAAKKLTYYMVPKDRVVVSSFPQTANGKLDRKALPDPPLPAAASSSSAASAAGSVGDKSSSVAPASSATNSSKGKSTPRALTMTDHVCCVFESVRGRRPSPSSSFAAMGVDSLGAILFIRCLTESVGGRIRIKPAEVYGSGVTISSFSLSLARRLAQEDPEALHRLGLTAPTDNARSSLEDGMDGSGNEACEEEEALDTRDDSELAASFFDELVASNAPLFEGLRGIFCFMVLYDHWHNPYDPMGYSLAINSDVHLFIVLTGFTTALQLRDAAPALAQILSGASSADRPPFNWKNFLLTRAVGIFPILWFALLLCAPRWVLQDKGGTAFMVQARRLAATDPKLGGGCAVMYVAAIQTWNVACRRVGPDDLAYACIIWGCFIMYAVLRTLLRWAQDALPPLLGSPLGLAVAPAGGSSSPLWVATPPRPAGYRPAAVVSPSDHGSPGRGDEESRLRGLSDDQSPEDGAAVHRFEILGGASPSSSPAGAVGAVGGEKRTALSLWALVELAKYNRLPPLPAACAAAVLLLGHFGLFLIIWLCSTHSKAPITFIVYFTGGAAGAAVCENIHWCLCLYELNSSSSSGSKDKAKEQQQRGSIWSGPFSLLRRFGADALLLLCAFLCAPWPVTQMVANDPLERSFGNFLKWAGLPFFVLLLLVALCLQEQGEERRNISRLVLTNPIARLLGYVSYTSYLFQHIAFEFYGHIIANNASAGLAYPSGAEEYRTLYLRQWFAANVSPGLKTCGVLVLLVFCYLVQWLYQDVFVAWLYSRAMQAFAGRTGKR